MNKEIIILGIGGNGVLTIAEIIANIANTNNFCTSIWTFYGSQMRGGEVGACIKISNFKIINPRYNVADIFAIINDTFLYKYQNLINENTIIFNDNNNMKILAQILKTIHLTNFLDIETTLNNKFKNPNVMKKNFEIVKEILKKQ